MKKLTRKQKTHWMAKTAIMSAIAIVLMYLEVPLPFVPPFLTLDFSEVPILIAAFSLGPVSAIAMELIKNLAHLLLKGPVAFGLGQLANFLIGCAFVVPAAIIYRRYKSRKTAVIGMAAGVLSMTLFASLANYFVLLPFYATVMEFPVQAIVGMANEAGNKMVTDLRTLVAFAFAPFNIVKGTAVSIIVLLIYKKVSCILHKDECDI